MTVLHLCNLYRKWMDIWKCDLFLTDRYTKLEKKRFGNPQSPWSLLSVLFNRFPTHRMKTPNGDSGLSFWAPGLPAPLENSPRVQGFFLLHCPSFSLFKEVWCKNSAKAKVMVRWNSFCQYSLCLNTPCTSALFYCA